MADAALLLATRVLPPTAATSVPVTGTSTTAQNLSAHEGKRVMLQAKTETVAIRFGGAAVTAAVATDISLADGERMTVDIPKSGERSYFRAIATTSATLDYAVVGE